MTQENTYLTKEKMEALMAELNELKTIKRREIAQDLEYAKSLGDLSENAEYQEAREAQGNLEERIGKIEQLLKNSVVVAGRASDTINIGSKIVLQKQGANGTQEYAIVSSEEADVSSGRLSYNSPLGQTLIGKKKGQNFTLKSPKGNIEYTVVNVL